MTNLKPIEAYSIFMAIKLHFNSKSYSYFKYGGKISITEQTYNMKKDKYVFYKLSKRYDADEFPKFILANILKNPKIYSFGLLDEDAASTYEKYKTNIESLEYKFAEDISFIKEWAEKNKVTMDACFDPKEYPPLLKMYQQKDIMLETLVILDEIFKFFPKWNKLISDTLIWPKIYEKCQKYREFLEIDIGAYKKIIKARL